MFLPFARSLSCTKTLSALWAVKNKSWRSSPRWAAGAIRELWLAALNEQGVSNGTWQPHLCGPAHIVAEDLQNGRTEHPDHSLISTSGLKEWRTWHQTTSQEKQVGLCWQGVHVVLHGRRLYNSRGCLLPIISWMSTMVWPSICRHWLKKKSCSSLVWCMCMFVHIHMCVHVWIGHQTFIFPFPLIPFLKIGDTITYVLYFPHALLSSVLGLQYIVVCVHWSMHTCIY